MSILEKTLSQLYEVNEGSEVLEEYCRRHGVESAGILTIYDDERAHLTADYLAPCVRNKVAVEVGGGIGLLALHLAEHAKHVYVIEADPNWTWVFVSILLKDKPKNVTFIFGAASEMEGILHADVAYFCTHSGRRSMRETAIKFAPVVIDVYADLIRDSDNQELKHLAKVLTEEPATGLP